MSEIAIWNLALGRLGDDGTVASPTERSRQAELCRQFWPIARNTALESHPWNFATRRAALAPIAAVAHSGYGYAYAFPANAIAVWKVGARELIVEVDHDADARRLPYLGVPNPTEREDFEIETLEDGTKVILSNTPEAYARFTVLVTDITKFSPLFTDAVAHLLASYLAGPILKGTEGVNMSRAKLQDFRLAIGQAAASDSNQRRRAQTIRQDHQPDWMRAR